MTFKETMDKVDQEIRRVCESYIGRANSPQTQEAVKASVRSVLQRYVDMGIFRVDILNSEIVLNTNSAGGSYVFVKPPKPRVIQKIPKNINLKFHGIQQGHKSLLTQEL